MKNCWFLSNMFYESTKINGSYVALKYFYFLTQSYIVDTYIRHNIHYIENLCVIVVRQKVARQPFQNKAAGNVFEDFSVKMITYFSNNSNIEI